MQFSSNVARLEPSATLALAARARQLKADGVPVVDLSAGEPQYPAPDFACQGAIDAIAAGKTGYPPTPGTPRLREAIAGYLVQTTARGSVDPAGVMVSAGVKQALFNCCYALFGPGDEVLIPAPFWPSYTTIVELAGATPVVVDTTWDSGFVATVDLLESARTERTRGLMLNSPSNPTGAIFDLDRMSEILEWADRHGIWVLSDEIYRRIGFGVDVPSVYDVQNVPARTVLLDGMSKAFCMPGFRIGYAVGPTELIKKASDLQGQTTSGAVGPAQAAAAAALADSDRREAFVSDLVGKLTDLRRRGLEGLGRVEALDVRAPAGAIYFYVRLRDASRSSMDVAEELLRDQAVASVPDEPFGSPGHLRFNFAVQPETLDEGIERIATYFEG